MPTLSINGMTVRAKENATVLDVANEVGIYIPTLCHHPDLPTFGACRVCMVDVNGRLETACRAPVWDGMVIRTDTEEVRNVRRANVNLILTNHSQDCQTCAKNNNCQLQEVSAFVGVTPEGMEGFRRFVTDLEPDQSNPCFSIDRSKCILCGICIRTCEEINGVGAIDFAFRGNKTSVSVLGNKPLRDSTCESCGECVERCPTAALSLSEHLVPEREVETICPYCGVGCSLFLGIRGESVVGVRGNRKSPVNAGDLCVKGRFGFHFINHPERLRKPLIKRNGDFTEASWDEALDLVAQRLGQIKDTHGAQALGGISSARCTNEENYVFQKFVRMLGTNNVDHCARLCHAPTVVGLNEVFGSGAMTNSIADLEEAGAFFIIGSNTTETHPVIGYRVRRARKKGAKLIVADPRPISLSEEADVFLQLRPGTNTALLLGMAKVIVDEKLYAADFIEQRCTDFDEYAASFADISLEEIGDITGVPLEQITRAARIYAETKPAAILYAMGITQHSHGTDNVMALAHLAMLTGNLGVRGGGVNPLRGQNNVQGACDMGALPNVFPGYQPVSSPQARSKFEQAYGTGLSSQPGITMTEMFKEALTGSLKALYIMGENPMLSEADLGKTAQALEKLEFVVVQDIFFTETAALADVVLPAASFAEKEGSFVNTERRVQKVNKAITPPGEARGDSEIISALAAKMGMTGFDYATSGDVMVEIASLVPNWAGISYARIEDEGGLCWPCRDSEDPGTPILHTRGFLTKDQRARFTPIAYAPAQELPDDEYPFVLTTGRVLYHFHTGTMTRKSQGLNTLHENEKVMMNAGDAQRLGIVQGGPVRVTSRRGEVEAVAELREDMQEGTIFMTFHFVEACANVLTNSAWDPKAKIPELKVCAVRVASL